MRPGSPPPPPWRPGNSGVHAGGVDASGSTSGAHYPTYGSWDRRPDWPVAPEFFTEALDAAMALVHADGGELATLDDTRQRLVLRARRTRPHVEASMSGFGSMGPMGAPSRSSQPLSGSHAPSALDPFAEIDQQSTALLPGTLLTRAYRPGERLIGYTWQRGEPVILRGEECRALPGGTAPADPEAAWHLAVPIHRPGSFLPPRSPGQIIGVIALHNRDPLWSFGPRDVELLVLHADRVSAAMKADELARLNAGQAALLEVLRGAGGSVPELPNLYLRVRDVVRQLIDAPSFALLKYDTRTDELTFALAERDGQPLPVPPITSPGAPRWWSAVRGGGTVCISAPEDRAAHPEYCMLGFGEPEPVQSLLAAPLSVGKTLIGAIVAGSPHVDAYAPEHVRLFETVARSAAVVIENAMLADERSRSLQQARAKAEQLSVLNNAVLTLNASLDLDATLRALARQAKGLTKAQVCTVFLLDDTEDALVARATNLDLRSEPRVSEGAAAHAPLPLEEVRIPLAWRDIGQQLTQQQYLLWDDLDSDWQRATPLGRLLESEQVYEALILPVTTQESPSPSARAHTERRSKPLGALWVYTPGPGPRHHFGAEEIGLLQGLAGQAAIAISNARLYQQLERAYEQQKELDRYKDEFILTVSHEFRTPLTAIDGYMGLISRHGEHLPREKLEQFAEEIRLSTSQLASMIGMLADANRMSSQPLALQLRPVNVRAATDTVLKQQSPEAQPRLRNQIPPDLWVPADADRLGLVISNLLSNAIKYSPQHQPVDLTARLETREALARAGRAHVAAEGAPERWVVVSVTDYGDGISPEDQARLFQKFVRLSKSLTTSVRGTGLGLWICRQYVEAMGGDIWLESAVGEGAVFHFCLPATSAP
jgi:signal transduction histidine kinase